MKGSSFTTSAGPPVRRKEPGELGPAGYHIVSTDGVTNATRRVELNGVVSESLMKVPQKPARSASHKSVKAKSSGA
jgi:hypothetical protein